MSRAFKNLPKTVRHDPMFSLSKLKVLPITDISKKVIQHLITPFKNGQTYTTNDIKEAYPDKKVSNINLKSKEKEAQELQKLYFNKTKKHSKQCLGYLAETSLAELIEYVFGPIETKKLNGHCNPDVVTKKAIYEIKSQTWCTTGTAKEKVLYAIPKYEVVAKRNDKRLYVVLTGYLEFYFKYSHTPYLSPENTHLQHHIDFSLGFCNAKFIGLTDILKMAYCKLNNTNTQTELEIVERTEEVDHTREQIGALERLIQNALKTMHEHMTINSPEDIAHTRDRIRVLVRQINNYYKELDKKREELKDLQQRHLNTGRRTEQRAAGEIVQSQTSISPSSRTYNLPLPYTSSSVDVEKVCSPPNVVPPAPTRKRQATLEESFTPSTRITRIEANHQTQACLSPTRIPEMVNTSPRVRNLYSPVEVTVPKRKRHVIRETAPTSPTKLKRTCANSQTQVCPPLTVTVTPASTGKDARLVELRTLEKSAGKQVPQRKSCPEVIDLTNDD